MYCYKLNNSYTTYINYTYINDCISICKKKKESSPNPATVPATSPVQKTTLIPLPINTRVQHKVWGDGRLVSKSDSGNGIITVAFGRKRVQFIYPDAFNQGHLLRV